MTDIDNILLHCAHRRTADEPRKILVSMRSPLPSQKSLTSNDKNNFISVDMLQSSQTSFISNTLEEYIFLHIASKKKPNEQRWAKRKPGHVTFLSNETNTLTETKKSIYIYWYQCWERESDKKEIFISLSVARLFFHSDVWINSNHPLNREITFYLN